MRLCKITLTGDLPNGDELVVDFLLNMNDVTIFRIDKMLNYDNNPTVEFEPVRYLTEDQYQKVKDQL